MSPHYPTYLKQKENTVRILFYAFWMIFNLLQAGFTDLLYDEAYYWVCSMNIDWGHFYSPPFIDVMIQAGYFLFKSALGVRLLFTIMSTAGIYLLEKLLVRKDLILYYVIISSMIFMQVIGVLAAPDIPLFFFTLTFYLVFRKHIEKESLLTTILLAINTALLLYIKYHGIIVIGFTFLINIGYLARRWRSYLWILLAVALFIPHILWQVENGFPTIAFHLFERPGGSLFELKNILDYIPGQILFAGPFVSIVLFISLRHIRVENRFEKTLLFNLLAMYAFFLLISIYHHIEINWTVIGIPPLVILSHKVISSRENYQKWVYRLLIPSLVLALFFRLVLIFPGTVPIERLRNELHGHSEWAASIKEASNDLPVVFTSRYQTASVYSFYSGGEISYTINPTQKSDYDFFGYEEKLQGKTVYLITGRGLNVKTDTIKTNKGIVYGTRIENFRSYKRLKLVSGDPAPEKTGPDKFIFRLRWENPYPYEISFLENPDLKSKIGYQLYKDGERILSIDNYMPATELSFEKDSEVIIEIKEAGDYELQFYLQTAYVYGYPVSKIFNVSR